jgi:hypothetical protein
MIPISLRRANNPMRTVFAIRIAADTSMTNDTRSTPTRNTRVIENRRSRNALWSTTRSMPGWPRRTASTWAYRSGSLSLTRRDAGSASGSTLSTSAFWSLNSSMNRAKASSLVS